MEGGTGAPRCNEVHDGIDGAFGVDMDHLVWNDDHYIGKTKHLVTRHHDCCHIVAI